VIGGATERGRVPLSFEQEYANRFAAEMTGKNLSRYKNVLLKTSVLRHQEFNDRNLKSKIVIVLN
jgi:hypothetical protein